jgi:hypothetical protein
MAANCAMNLSTEAGQVQRAAEGANEADGPFCAPW